MRWKTLYFYSKEGFGEKIKDLVQSQHIKAVSINNTDWQESQAGQLWCQKWIAAKYHYSNFRVHDQRGRQDSDGFLKFHTTPPWEKQSSQWALCNKQEENHPYPIPNMSNNYTDSITTCLKFPYYVTLNMLAQKRSDQISHIWNFAAGTIRSKNSNPCYFMRVGPTIIIDDMYLRMLLCHSWQVPVYGLGLI